MRISAAAQQLGTSPRMLRYRELLGLLPPVREPATRWRPAGRQRAARGPAHRQFSQDDLAAVALGLDIERRLDISPAELAFGLRVLGDPRVRADVAELGRRLGRIPAPPGQALDFEKERALRLLNLARRPAAGPRPAAGTSGPASGAPAPSAQRPPPYAQPPGTPDPRPPPHIVIMTSVVIEPHQSHDHGLSALGRDGPHLAAGMAGNGHQASTMGKVQRTPGHLTCHFSPTGTGAKGHKTHLACATCTKLSVLPGIGVRRACQVRASP